MKNLARCLVVAGMMVAPPSVSAGTIYKCASGNGSLAYQDTPCQGGSPLVAPRDTGASSGTAANGQVPRQCLERVAARPAQSMALQQEQVRVHSRMRVFAMRMGAPAPDDDPVRRGKCEAIVAKYDGLLEELGHSDLDDLKKLARCFVDQSNQLFAEQAKLNCDIGY